MFREGKLCGIYGVEACLGRLVIACSERRTRITRGGSTKTRGVKKALKKLREKERKRDIVYKTAGVIGKLAIHNNAIIVIGNVHRGKKKLVESTGKNTLRHRIHQWSASLLVEVLNGK